MLPAALAADSVPHIGSVDYYGLRKISHSRVYKVVGVSAGDPIPPSKGALEERLEKIPGVVAARVEAVCCEGHDGMLFVGIEERGAAHFALRTPPAGDATLPAEITSHELLLLAARPTCVLMLLASVTPMLTFTTGPLVLATV